MKIVIIDSGVDLSHPHLKKNTYSGISIVNDEGAFLINNDISDSVGHGTAVCGILNNAGINAEIYCIKVFTDKNLEVEHETLCFALNYVYKNIQCEFILMSLGTSYVESVGELEELCEMLTKRGTQIVSAFDNNGSLSYPASFKCVIGVDSINYLQKNAEFEVNDFDDVVDLRCKGGLQRVCWTNPRFRLVTGTSFAAAHALVILIDAYNKGARKKIEYLDILKKTALHCFSSGTTNFDCTSLLPNKIKRAITYPYNKEIQTLIRYRDLLPYEIAHICDEPLHGSVGKTIKTHNKKQKEKRIISIYDIGEFTDYDTLIVGHLSELSLLAKKDLLKEILNKCIQNNKNLYSFDDLSTYSEELTIAKHKKLLFEYPIATKVDPGRHFGRLWVSSKPVLGVFGTSSKQGKFSLQLMLRKAFISKGYKIAQLGTEPSSLVAGLERIFPMGYQAKLNVRDEAAVVCINEMMHQMELANPDLIIVGGQSNVIPFDIKHVFDLTLSQWDFIIGTRPDVFVVCVNPQDPIEYIDRTIRFLESVHFGKVLGLVLFPIKLRQEWPGFSFSTEVLDPLSYQKIIDHLTEHFNLPVFENSESGAAKLRDLIIEYLSSQ